MKWLFLLSIYLATQQLGIACVCGFKKPMDAELFQQYKYVALVKVLSLEHVVLNVGGQAIRKYKFTVEVIENFKANLPSELFLDGYGSSCDIGLRPGEEWLIFPEEFSGFTTVFPCGYSSEYKDKNGIKDFRYHSDDQFLDYIRQLVGRPVKVKDGLVEEFYPNQQKGYTELYKKGKLDGERLVWHSNGTLWGREFYENGQQHGTSTWWYADGLMESKGKFDKGIPIDTSWRWYEIETDSIKNASYARRDPP